MPAGGMAAHHDALAESLPEIETRRLRLFDDLADRDLRREIVAGHGDRDAVRVHAARHLAEARGLQRAPVAAVDEQRELAGVRAARFEDVDGLARTRAELQAESRRGLPSWPRRGRRRHRAPSARKSQDARAPARGCCIPPRSRSPSDAPPLRRRVKDAGATGKPALSFRLQDTLLVVRGPALYECPMKVDGTPTRTIWLEADGWSVGIIDQTVLPHSFAKLRLTTLDDMARAIKTMQVRGAPLIGAAAAYGICACAARRHIGRSAGARLRGAACDPADRDQLEMGARRDGRRRPQPAARGARCGGLPPRGGNRRRGRGHQRRSASTA